MAPPATEDPGPVQPGTEGDMSFDVGVFKKYLSALLPPGKSSSLLAPTLF